MKYYKLRKGEVWRCWYKQFRELLDTVREINKKLQEHIHPEAEIYLEREEGFYPLKYCISIPEASFSAAFYLEKHPGITWKQLERVGEHRLLVRPLLDGQKNLDMYNKITTLLNEVGEVPGRAVIRDWWRQLPSCRERDLFRGGNFLLIGGDLYYTTLGIDDEYIPERHTAVAKEVPEAEIQKLLSDEIIIRMDSRKLKQAGEVNCSLCGACYTAARVVTLCPVCAQLTVACNVCGPPEASRCTGCRYGSNFYFGEKE